MMICMSAAAILACSAMVVSALRTARNASSGLGSSRAGSWPAMGWSVASGVLDTGRLRDERGKGDTGNLTVAIINIRNQKKDELVSVLWEAPGKRR